MRPISHFSVFAIVVSAFVAGQVSARGYTDLMVVNLFFVACNWGWLAIQIHVQKKPVTP